MDIVLKSIGNPVSIGNLLPATDDLDDLSAFLLGPRRVHPGEQTRMFSVLQQLDTAGRLTEELAWSVLLKDVWLASKIPAEFTTMRRYAMSLVWELTAGDPPGTHSAFIPYGLRLEGLRFVLRALSWPDKTKHAEDLGRASLTPTEFTTLAEYLLTQPVEEQWRAVRLRGPAGDAGKLLAAIGRPGAARLAGLARYAHQLHHPERLDRAEIVRAAADAGPENVEHILATWPSELVNAALGRNRKSVLRRVKNSALIGIAAYGLLPLEAGETALDRFMVLREVARKGAKFGPDRRLSHARAVEIALDHLAQTAGYAGASQLEWDCESQIVIESPSGFAAGDYTVTYTVDGDGPVIGVHKAGKTLKTVPKPVRADPRYNELREHQERMRAQARRVRSDLIEPLVATGASLDVAEYERLLALPSAARMLSLLVWRDHTGAIGFPSELDLSGRIRAVHPVDLHEAGTLAEFQQRVVREHIRQPVKQVYREVYVLTPAEVAAGTESARFSLHRVDGRTAGKLLVGRGWKLPSDLYTGSVTKRVDEHTTAHIDVEYGNWFGEDEVEIRGIWFSAGDGRLPLQDVPRIAFSETMRDADLVVSVAGTADGRVSAEQAESRAQLLVALIEDLRLDRVTIEGRTAVVRGSRATYRVHLASGSIHLEPGGYLCIVPKAFGDTAHRRLFLPFVDEDVLTSVILSKVLLLNEDEKITDPVILQQLPQ